jgi:TATA-box binding protein (TBP) (component of TFIID and TFIIIB)
MKTLNYNIYAMLLSISSLILSASMQAQDLTLADNYFASENMAKSQHYSNVGNSSLTAEESVLSKGKNLDQNKQFNLVVVYESNAPWAAVFNAGKYTKTGNETMNEIMESYELTIIEQIEIDEDNECIVLEINDIFETPMDAARKLSLVDHVVMVYVKEMPQNKNSGTDHKLSQY